MDDQFDVGGRILPPGVHHSAGGGHPQRAIALNREACRLAGGTGAEDPDLRVIGPSADDACVQPAPGIRGLKFASLESLQILHHQAIAGLNPRGDGGAGAHQVALGARREAADTGPPDGAGPGRTRK